MDSGPDLVFILANACDACHIPIHWPLQGHPGSQPFMQIIRYEVDGCRLGKSNNAEIMMMAGGRLYVFYALATPTEMLFDISNPEFLTELLAWLGPQGAGILSTDECADLRRYFNRMGGQTDAS